MIRSILTTGSLTLCWLLSPDSLSIAGNSIGKGGWYFLIPFFLAFVVSCWASNIIYRVTRHINIGIQPSMSPSEKTHSMGSLIYLTLTFGCCLSLVLFIPTGTLLTAGFLFNETFLYQFSHYNFSFVMLAVVLLPHLFNEKLPVAMQAFSFCATICCLFILILFGLLSGQDYFSTTAGITTKVVDPLQIPFSFWVLFCTSMLLFLGYDQGKSYLLHWRYRVLLLSTGAIIIGLWCAASLLHVPQIHLTFSTIPYILGAQEILGPPGRIVIGVMIICGTFSVVNGLFIITNRLITQQLVSATPFNPAVFSIIRQRYYKVIVSTIIGLFLATGLEWEEELETFIYGSLLLWLLLTAVRIQAGLLAFQKAGGNTSRIHFFLPLLFLASFISLVLTHTQPTTLVAYILLILAVASTITAAWLLNIKGYHKPLAVPLRR